MAVRRILYGAALAVALLFQIYYDGYLAHIVLVTVAALPLLSLLLTLPALLGLRLTAEPSAPEVERGREGEWLLRVDSPGGLPLTRLALTLEFSNRMTGWRKKERVKYAGLSRGSAGEFPLNTDHCGLLECRVVKLRVADCLGLFSIPRSCHRLAQVLVTPIPEAPERLPELDGLAKATLRPRPGGGPGEDYELRPYRPGDPLRQIHWKLTSKLDEPVVRETMEPCQPLVVFTFDHFGPPERLDRMLDRLCALSWTLAGADVPFVLRWAGPEQGELHSCAISNPRALISCLFLILSTPAPAAGSSILARPEVVTEPGAYHIHVTDGEEVGP